MTLNNIINKLQLKILTCVNNTELFEKEIKSCYIGDLLSWVMGRAQANDIWITIMGNINAVAVASLADVACVVLTENAVLDEPARLKAEQQEVIFLQTEENSYKLAVKIYELLKDS